MIYFIVGSVLGSVLLNIALACVVWYSGQQIDKLCKILYAMSIELAKAQGLIK